MEEKLLTFTLTVAEANVILEGLGELPGKKSIGIMNKIQMQAQPQLVEPISDTKDPNGQE